MIRFFVGGPLDGQWLDVGNGAFDVSAYEAPPSLILSEKVQPDAVLMPKVITYQLQWVRLPGFTIHIPMFLLTGTMHEDLGLQFWWTLPGTFASERI